MTDRELLQQALDALEIQVQVKRVKNVIEAIRTRLAQPEPVEWKVWTVHNHIFFSIGVQTFQINDVLEHEPEVSVEEFSEWLATQLRHALTQLSNTAPPNKEWVGLTVIKDAGESSLQLVFQTREQADNAKAKLKEKNNDR